jgi:FkbM family methyltransferase
MHYQCRSMEHFIERLKLRPQFQNQPGLWEGYNVNQIQDTAPLHLVERVRTQLASFARGPSPGFGADVIFDIGMSEGNDTAFYLAKGFRVVGVEPDVQTYYALLERFAPEIEAGRLVIHNLAADARYGEIVEFFHHERHQGVSGLSHGRAEFALGYKSYHVMTIDWATLIAQHGVPHYAKIDIEGNERAFLKGAAGSFPLPLYISIEISPSNATIWRRSRHCTISATGVSCWSTRTRRVDSVCRSGRPRAGRFPGGLSTLPARSGGSCPANGWILPRSRGFGRQRGGKLAAPGLTVTPGCPESAPDGAGAYSAHRQDSITNTN